MSAIRHNARCVRERLRDGVKLLCVVKADAYGHGAVSVAKALSVEADAFAVAVPQEGLQLREAGVGQMIVVLGRTDAADREAALRARLSLAVFDADDLRALEALAQLTGIEALAHLKVDTGMARIGACPGEPLEALLDAWQACPHVRMEGMFTHFCVADTDPAFTDQQHARFERAIAQVHARGFAPIAHCAASTALHVPAYQHDMVRAGIVLYGTGVDWADGLRYAQRLTSHPVRLEWIQPGDTVGYGRKFTAQRPTRVMTIPVGYADGYFRALSGRADVLVRGRRAPLIGTVCMDMLMVDVTDVPGVTLEDEVVLLGAQGDERITPDELAEIAGTIPYEIMLAWRSRVKRVVAE